MKYIYCNYSSHTIMSNQIQYYIEYLSSWFYHNVLYTETMVVLLKFIVFVVLLTLIVYENYFAAGVVVVICASVYLYLCHAGAAGSGPGPVGSVSVARRVEKDELTTGVPLIKEGFGIAMPKIIMGDDSGKDHRRSNKFIEEDSRDFTNKYFNSKKCGIGSGIGGITMFGSNELIGGERKVELGGIYDFAGNYVTNDSTDDKGKRYKYFLDCVFKPVKRSVDSVGGDFRVIKKAIYTNINMKIIDITKVINRFNTTLLFNTKEDATADYIKRISLSTSPNNDNQYVSLINGNTNQDKLKNIQKLDNDDNINDKMYADLLTSINNNREMNSTVKQRHLEIYAKVYEFRKKFDNIFANMRTQTKDDASFMYTVRVGESVIQELRMMLSYLKIIQLTNDIILFEETSGNGIYKSAPAGLPPTGTLDSITYANIAIKSKITGAANNIFKIPPEDDTYNNKDEKRYLYGITYYIDKAGSDQ